MRDGDSYWGGGSISLRRWRSATLCLAPQNTRRTANPASSSAGSRSLKCATGLEVKVSRWFDGRQQGSVTVSLRKGAPSLAVNYPPAAHSTPGWMNAGRKPHQSEKLSTDGPLNR